MFLHSWGLNSNDSPIVVGLFPNVSWWNQNGSPLIKRGNGHLWMILSPKPPCTKAFPLPFAVCVCVCVSEGIQLNLYMFHG